MQNEATVGEGDLDTWAPLQFLLGEWVGTGSGEPGEEGTGHAAFTLDLDGKILVRRSRAEYAPRPGEATGVSHEDLLIVYRVGAQEGFRAVYFDSEGHTINYRVYFPEKQPGVIFESEAATPGPRFRLEYDLAPDGGLATAFSIAPPGQGFAVHVRGVTHRRE